MKRRRIVVVGTLAGNPYAGLAWQKMQFAVGLQRLGHDVYYFETTSSWPYDPICRSRVCNSDYAVPYLAQVCESFGLSERWAYRRSYSDKAWFGLSRAKAEELLSHADAVLNVTAATRFAEEGLRVGRLVYVGTDPVIHEMAFVQGNKDIRTLVEEHDDLATFGENIGSPDCPVPPLPRLRSRTRQPVLLDRWQAGVPSKKEFTTVGNWKQVGCDIEYRGETFYWSKHLEFLKFIELPLRIRQPIELAIGVANLQPAERYTLESNRWRLADAHALSADPLSYRNYICASRGEFTVAKDQNIRLRTGWFSDRSACYLAAGRPVITQDTGFGKFIPTGEGLFSFKTIDEIVAAFDSVNSDYEKHSRAARAIAEEYFRAETVLAKMLNDLGL
jgi:hypothetical protein